MSICSKEKGKGGAKRVLSVEAWCDNFHHSRCPLDGSIEANFFKLTCS